MHDTELYFITYHGTCSLISYLSCGRVGNCTFTNHYNQTILQQGDGVILQSRTVTTSYVATCTRISASNEKSSFLENPVVGVLKILNLWLSDPAYKSPCQSLLAKSDIFSSNRSDQRATTGYLKADWSRLISIIFSKPPPSQSLTFPNQRCRPPPGAPR